MFEETYLKLKLKAPVLDIACSHIGYLNIFRIICAQREKFFKFLPATILPL